MSPSMGTGLQQLTPDTFRVSRVDGGGRYPDAAAMKAAIIDEANAFAQRQGKVAVPISGHDETLRGHLLTADYEFRLASPGEAATAPVVPAPSPAAAAPAPPAVAPPVAATLGVVAPAAVAPAAVAAAPPAADSKPSFYDELIMLDDLRKRGILTDAEFQSLKAKLIATR